MIGSVLDKYEVLQKIGEGGMATVYRGLHTTLHRSVAVKVLHPHLSSSTRNRKRFAREARAIEQLHHPNILEIFDYSGEHNDECYIITEYVEGLTLTELVDNQGRLPSEVVSQIGISLSAALGYAHQQGVLHRDLKPDNVMLRADGEVKLMDFGIARFLDEAQVTLTGALVGSPSFMSPEQAKEMDLDHRSDLFSLGTLLYFLVSGELPFKGSNPSLILRNIIEGNRRPLTEACPEASPELAEVIETLLSVHPEDRPSSAVWVEEQLRDSLEMLDFPLGGDWSLASYLSDPTAYTVRWESWLKDALLERGRAKIAEGDHLTALTLFNRLLTIEEDNPEALALIQEFHGVNDQPLHRRWVWALVGFLLLSTLSASLWWTTQYEASQTAPPPVSEITSPVFKVAELGPPDLAAPKPKASATLAEATPSDRALEQAAPDVKAKPRRSQRKRARTKINASAAPQPKSDIAAAKPSEIGSLAPACVSFRSPRVFAEIYHKGTKVGHTRSLRCITLPSGSVELTFKGSTVEETTKSFEFAPGETIDRLVVSLERAPATLRFPKRYDAGCVVILDGTPKGSLGTLGYATEIPSPQAPHQVSLVCGDATFSAAYDGLDYPDVLFHEGDGLP